MAVNFRLINDNLKENEILRKRNSTLVTYRSFSFNNFNNFKTKLLDFDWDSILLDPNFNAESVFDIFFNYILSIFNECFKLRYAYTNNRIKKSEVWYSNDLAVLRNKLTLSYRISKSTGAYIDKQRYNSLKNEYRHKIKEAKLNYNIRVIENSNNKCKTAWSIINKSRTGNVNKDIPFTADRLNEVFFQHITDIKSRIDKPTISYKELLIKF